VIAASPRASLGGEVEAAATLASAADNRDDGSNGGDGGNGGSSSNGSNSSSDGGGDGGNGSDGGDSDDSNRTINGGKHKRTGYSVRADGRRTGYSVRVDGRRTGYGVRANGRRTGYGMRADERRTIGAEANSGRADSRRVNSTKAVGGGFVDGRFRRLRAYVRQELLQASGFHL
jgi:hypothetical protein